MASHDRQDNKGLAVDHYRNGKLRTDWEPAAPAYPSFLFPITSHHRWRVRWKLLQRAIPLDKGGRMIYDMLRKHLF